ncbi:MAG: caspase family protein [Saprospiraceae bacterium]
MKKNLIIAFLSCVPYFATCQSNFIVKSGETKEITDNIEIKEFRMENNSTLIISGLSSWSLKANVSEIGENCKIIGNGKTGKTPQGAGSSGRAKKCKSGRTGKTGATGGTGSNGVNIKIRTTFLSLGSLTIEAKGGRGGNGGKGGNGQNGGSEDFDRYGFRTCGGGHGGQGGKGGTAGRGGNGGNVEILYNVTENYSVTPKLSNNPDDRKGVIRIYNSRGNNGAPGKGGDGGSRGHKTKKGGSTGTGGEAHQAFGKDGYSNLEEFDVDCFDMQAYENYALIISVSNYSTPEPKWTEQAIKLKNTLEANYYFEEIKHLNNPTQADLQKVLINYLNLSEDANVLIYLSGHGSFNKVNDYYRFQTNDEDFLTFTQIRAEIKKANLNTLLFIFDACYSGKLLDDRTIDNRPPTKNTLEPPELICGLSGKSIITAGYEEELVDDEMVDAIVKILETNTEQVLTAEALFYELVGRDEFSFETQTPSIGKLKNSSSGSFIFYKK